MRRRLTLVALVPIVLLSSLGALAEDGLRWRRTTPRAVLATRDEALELRVPAARAWGIAAAPVAVAPGQRYRARADLDVEGALLRGAFVRVALYERADGRGRQRSVIDSPPLARGQDRLAAEFTAPAWARAAKLRVLARVDAALSGPFLVADPALVPLRGVPPAVVLRPDE